MVCDPPCEAKTKSTTTRVSSGVKPKTPLFEQQSQPQSQPQLQSLHQQNEMVCLLFL
jgi:hypothetical protein